MKRPLLSCLVVSLLALPGCGLLPPPAAEPTGADQRSRDLSAELAEAEAALAAQPKDNALQEKVARLRQQISRLEADHLAKASKLWAGQQPGAALHELDIGLLAVPGSSALQRRRTYYAELLERRLELPRAELKLVRGRYVADSLRVEKQVQTLAPGSNDATLAALDRERQALATETLAIGRQALERKHYGFARWAFNIAGDLGAADATALLAETSKREKQKNKKAPPAELEPELSEQQVLEARRKLLKQQIQTAISKADLHTAQASVSELRRLFPTEPELAGYRQTLAPLLKEQVQVLQADGNRRYRDGDISGALAAWKQALALAPDNRELPPLIERAQKVEANLNSLRGQQRP